MRKNIIFALVFGILSLNACKKVEDKATENKETIMLTIDSTQVEVPKKPKNVIALDFGSLETLNELGIEVVGMPKSNLPKYLADFATKPSVADVGTLFEVNFEKVNELNPGIIFISGRMASNAEELKKIAPTVSISLDNQDVLGSLKKNISTFGEIFDKQDEAKKHIENIDQKVNALVEKTKTSNKKALVILHNNGKFSAFGKGSRFGVIHDVFGFPEVVENLQAARHGQPVSNEFILDANPDYLFIVDRSSVVNNEATDKSSIENALIQKTKAYKNGKIVYLDPEIWYISGDGITSFNKMIDEISASL